MRRRASAEEIQSHFDEKLIRATWDAGRKRLFFCLTDVIRVITLTGDPADYIKKLRKKHSSLAADWDTFVIPHALQTRGGIQPLNCADADGLRRIFEALPKFRKEIVREYMESLPDGGQMPAVEKTAATYSLVQVYQFFMA